MRTASHGCLARSERASSAVSAWKMVLMPNVSSAFFASRASSGLSSTTRTLLCLGFSGPSMATLLASRHSPQRRNPPSIAQEAAQDPEEVAVPHRLDDVRVRAQSLALVNVTLVVRTGQHDDRQGF